MSQSHLIRPFQIGFSKRISAEHCKIQLFLNDLHVFQISIFNFKTDILSMGAEFIEFNTLVHGNPEKWNVTFKRLILVVQTESCE